VGVRGVERPEDFEKDAHPHTQSERDSVLSVGHNRPRQVQSLHTMNLALNVQMRFETPYKTLSSSYLNKTYMGKWH
jgi:hypothetical protein